jgi:predicted component of type VI protein secretion system
MYLELCEMLGELCAVHPEIAEPAAPVYLHDNPALSFKELAERIRQLIPDDVSQKFKKFDMTKENKIFVCRGIARDQLELPAYYLAVETSEDRSKVAQLITAPERFKMLPASLISLKSRGVNLVTDHNPPTSLPSAGGLSYFRIVRNDTESDNWWRKIMDEGAVAVTFVGLEVPDKITLYGMLP